MADSIWIVRDPSGRAIGASAYDGFLALDETSTALLPALTHKEMARLLKADKQAAVSVDGYTLTREPLPVPGPSEHVAWLRYVEWPNGQTSIRVCDSDDEGAFKVYALTAARTGAA